MQQSAEHRITRIIFAGSFLISTVILVVLSLKTPIRSNIAASYMLGIMLVAGTMIIGALTGRYRRFLGFFLLISVLNIILVPAEAYIRSKGFRYESGIQFGYPRPYQFSPFEPDEKLFWKFAPSQPGINSYGFRGPEVRSPKPPGTYRIVFVGNSCTYQGFPHIIELILRDRDPKIECLNFATPGYTSYQGKVIVKSYIDELEPDLLVVSFGWNDRWLAYGSIDEEKTIIVSHSRLAEALKTIYSNWRTLQFFRKTLAPLLGRIEPLDTSRVPIDYFYRNLREIGGECEKRGIPVIFATEPSSHPSLGVPDFIIKSKYAASKESSLALFNDYNDAARMIAGESDTWRLVDLDSLISHRLDVREIFTGDGLHFSQGGLALVAEIESRFIIRHFLK